LEPKYYKYDVFRIAIKIQNHFYNVFSDLKDFFQKYMMATSNTQNIIFWSKDQLKTMDKNGKRVFLAAPYGTGKTTLLRTKLRRSISESVNPNNNINSSSSSSKNTKKFVFIIFEDSREYMRDSLLKMDIQREFKDVPEEISLHVYNVKNRAGKSNKKTKAVF